MIVINPEQSPIQLLFDMCQVCIREEKVFKETGVLIQQGKLQFPKTMHWLDKLLGYISKHQLLPG